MTHRKWLLLILLLLLIAGFFYFDLGRFLSFEYLKSQRDQLIVWRQAQPFQRRRAYSSSRGESIAMTGP